MAAGAGGLDEDQLFFAEGTTDLNDKKGHECFSFSSFACSDSKMLCFGGFNGGDVTNSGQESGSICMDYSSISSTSSNKIKTWPKSNRKRNRSGNEPGMNPGCLSGAPTGSHCY